MRIGIEICDDKNDNMDFTHLENGNPGIGGIYYQMLLMGDSLIKYWKNKYEIVYYHYNSSNKYPYGANDVLCEDNLDLIDKARSGKTDYLFVNCNKNKDWYKQLAKSNQKVLVRAGCYLDKSEVDYIMQTDNVVRVIAVASEEYDYYRDHDIIDRMICVENSIAYDDVEIRDNNAINSHKVAYIGSLVPQKGFEYLAKAWPEVIKKIPDAHLHVIGSGKLYNSNQKLGKYELAEEEFEKSFIKYLTDDNGQIIPSVTFHGVVGEGKGEILRDVTVGVVNPTALTECCCTSSLDFESRGIPVVTCARYGMPSTVINNVTGLTYKKLSTSKLAKRIIQLLSDRILNEQLSGGAADFAKYFDRKNMAIIWDRELEMLANNEPCIYRKANGNYYNDCKWFKVINAFLRRIMHLTFLPTSLDYKECYYNLGRIIMGVVRKLMG